MGPADMTAPDRPNPPGYLKRADAAIADGQALRAAEICRKGIAHDPANVSLRLKYANLLRSGGDPSGALALLTATPAPAAYDVHVLGLLADLQSAQGLDAAREQTLAELVARHPTHPRAFIERARKAEAAGDKAAEQAIYREGCTHHPAHFWLRYGLLRCQCQGACEPPFADLRRLRDEAVTNPAPHRLLISGLRRTRRFDDAAAAIALYARSCPGDPAVAMERAALATDTGDVRGAAAALEQALAATPDHTAIITKLSQCYRALGNVEGTRALLARLDPTSTRYDSVIARGWIEKSLGHRDAALASAARARFLQPAHPDPYALSASVLVDDGRAIEAIRMLEEAPAPVRLSDSGLRARSAAAWQSGDAETAITLMKSMRQSDPSRLLECLLEVGRRTEAIGILSDWVPRDSNEAAKKYFAEALVAANVYDFATTEARCRDALEMGSADVDVLELLAAAQVLSFRTGAAVETLERVIALRPFGRALAGYSGHVLSGSGFLGQIVNELLLDAHGTERLEAAVRLEPARAASAITSVLRDGSDYTGPALALLLAMRRAGAFDTTGAVGGDISIPAVIHQYWDDDSPPEDVRSHIKTMRTRHSDYIHRHYTRRKAERYLKSRFPRSTLRAFQLAPTAAARAEFFRLAVQAYDGGIYLDASIACRGRLDGVIPTGSDLVLYQDEVGAIGTRFMAAAPGHPLVTEALEDAVNALSEAASESHWLITGPGCLARSTARAIAARNAPALPPGVHIWTRQELGPVIGTWQRLRHSTGHLQS